MIYKVYAINEIKYITMIFFNIKRHLFKFYSKNLKIVKKE